MSLIIKMPDIRKVLMCGRGTQGWFRLHNLDYADFIKNGIAIEKLEEIDREMAAQVCRHARETRNESSE